MLTTLDTIRKMMEEARVTGLFTNEELREIREVNNIYKRALTNDLHRELESSLQKS